MKKLLALILTFAMLSMLAACGSDSTAPDGGDGQTYKVGLLQLVEHPSLDEIRTAIETELADRKSVV